MPFAEIMPGVAAGQFDAGLVIHEARFTYRRHGLTALVDLGEWWEGDTGLPIPLGAILARRGAVDPVAATGWIRESVRLAWADPTASRAYVLRARPGDGARRGGPAHRALRQRVHRGSRRRRATRRWTPCSGAPPPLG